MPMAKKSAKKKPAPHKKPTSARLLKNRPHEPEPPEVDLNVEAVNTESETETVEEEQLETPDNPKKPKRGRQARLPGTEDPAIEELEGLAEEYAEFRDKRMAMGEEEVKLKKELLEEMHKHNKVKYFHAGISIEVVNSMDKVRVRIKKDD